MNIVNEESQQQQQKRKRDNNNKYSYYENNNNNNNNQASNDANDDDVITTTNNMIRNKQRKTSNSNDSASSRKREKKDQQHHNHRNDNRKSSSSVIPSDNIMFSLINELSKDNNVTIQVVSPSAFRQCMSNLKSMMQQVQCSIVRSEEFTGIEIITMNNNSTGLIEARFLSVVLVKDESKLPSSFNQFHISLETFLNALKLMDSMSDLLVFSLEEDCIKLEIAASTMLSIDNAAAAAAKGTQIKIPLQNNDVTQDKFSLGENEYEFMVRFDHSTFRKKLGAFCSFNCNDIEICIYADSEDEYNTFRSNDQHQQQQQNQMISVFFLMKASSEMVTDIYFYFRGFLKKHTRTSDLMLMCSENMEMLGSSEYVASAALLDKLAEENATFNKLEPLYEIHVMIDETQSRDFLKNNRSSSSSNSIMFYDEDDTTTTSSNALLDYSVATANNNKKESFLPKWDKLHNIFKAKYSTKLLCDFTHGYDNCPFSMYLDSVLPLVGHYYSGNLSYVRFFLAPKVDESEFDM